MKFTFTVPMSEYVLIAENPKDFPRVTPSEEIVGMIVVDLTGVPENKVEHTLNAIIDTFIAAELAAAEHLNSRLASILNTMASPVANESTEESHSTSATESPSEVVSTQSSVQTESEVKNGNEEEQGRRTGRK